MKKLFFTGCIGLLFFELVSVYLIMPMPGSQQLDSIDIAYFLYQWRWVFRGLFTAMIILGLLKSSWSKKWLPALPLLLLSVIIYLVNFYMAADHMFYQSKKISLVNAMENKVDTNRLVIGIVNNGEAKAYPIRFLGYHHQVQDIIGGKPVMVTYCTVCRTGRVYEPTVNGKPEKFRLVGMDHFNAMFEDATTKSWWRQATGIAVTGKLKGLQLPEFFSVQTSLAKWLTLNPQSLVMQEDPSFESEYDTTMKFENGKGRSRLTGTDSLSWKDKSWVVGIRVGDQTKAYDWNRLKTDRIIPDKLGNIPTLLVLAQDNKTFFAFERPNENELFSLQRDTLLYSGHHFKINGQGIDTAFSLKPIAAYQEFWHSWQTFQTKTEKY
jgi:hypothetical protein